VERKIEMAALIPIRILAWIGEDVGGIPQPVVANAPDDKL
jgi:hypothetical protein